ncbi:MAG TPA: hypothetical protein VMV45_21300 [Casimicrobiaceae bacterium]|nr:hypothetical protein [Casimicrobiaceae bacterium]
MASTSPRWFNRAAATKGKAASQARPTGNPGDLRKVNPVSRMRTGAQASAPRRRLVADHLYFGVEARMLRAGMERVLARVSVQKSARARVDAEQLREDFRLDELASLSLIEALVAGELLELEGDGAYRLTAKFHEYASASVVAPLSRARAKALLEKTRALAAQINSKWVANPFRVRMVAVSGSYMSLGSKLAELSLWLVVRSRTNVRVPRWKRSPSKAEALHQIVSAVERLSSFIVVRAVANRHVVERPFSIVFLDDAARAESHPGAWDKVRDWGASISRRLVHKRGTVRAAHKQP